MGHMQLYGYFVEAIVSKRSFVGCDSIWGQYFVDDIIHIYPVALLQCIVFSLIFMQWD